MHRRGEVTVKAEGDGDVEQEENAGEAGVDGEVDVDGLQRRLVDNRQIFLRFRRRGLRGCLETRAGFAPKPHPLAPSPVSRPPPAGRGGTPVPENCCFLGGGAPSPGGGG